MKAYAGIGSRETPLDFEQVIKEITTFMDKLGYVTRSGGAPGADTMFGTHSKLQEIYLPWRGFNGSTSELSLDNMPKELVKKAEIIAQEYHPRWSQLSDAAKRLMTRNTFQILGSNLEDPVKLVICWTSGGLMLGGTSQAMRIARHLEIPIFNLYHANTLYDIKLFIHNLC